MKFLELYTDSACTQLYKVCPCYPIDYQSFSGKPTSITNPRTQKSYMAIGNINGAWMFFNNVTPITGGTPAFSTADGYMDTPTTFYCKNGIHFTITMQSREYGDLIINNIGIDDKLYSNGLSTTHRPGTVGYMYICAAEVNGTVYYGLTGFVTTGGFDTTWSPVLMSGSGFWAGAFRKSFNYGTKPDEGGQANGTIPHSNVGRSTVAPSTFPTGAQGFHAYIITPTGLDELQGSLWGEGSTLAKSLWQKFLNSKHNPIHCIVGCYRLPTRFMPLRLQSSGVHLGGVNIPISSGNCYTTNLRIYTLPSISTEVINPPFDSWLDYYGVSIKIFIPFCGTITAPAEKIFGKAVSISYRVDQANGNLAALVYTGNYDYILGELTGNVAYNIPVCGGDDGTLARLGAIASNVISLGDSIMTSMQNAFSGRPTAIGKSGLSRMQNLSDIVAPPFNTQVANCNMAGSVAACTNGIFYVEYLYANVAYAGYKEGNSQSDYAQAVGYPSYAGGTVGDFNGGYGEFYVIPNGWDVTGATAQEKNEIINLLETGVFVNGSQS